ncbi:MAG: hypothetical protein B7X07_06270 [Actinobacteria bacterium 21-64-8]|nr:MAG: hypothetical protein B7X07_06270 [Actinobacteria bacterium 21-64-8]
MMRAMATNVDVFGRALWDWARGGSVPEMIERDDGYFESGAGAPVYLAPLKEWPAAERQAMRYVRGRVVDVGCGAGRVALHLQRRGLAVVGLDRSAFALRAAKLLGVQSLWRASLDDLVGRLEDFDSVVLFGNNFGLFESPERARALLTSWAERAKPGTRIFAESTNAYGGAAPAIDRAYYRRNLANGRSPGEVRLRYRYEDLVSPWFTWLFVSRSEMRAIVHGTGWRIARVLGEHPSEPYVAVLEKL